MFVIVDSTTYIHMTLDCVVHITSKGHIKVSRGRFALCTPQSTVQRVAQHVGLGKSASTSASRESHLQAHYIYKLTYLFAPRCFHEFCMRQIYVKKKKTRFSLAYVTQKGMYLSYAAVKKQTLQPPGSIWNRCNRHLLCHK